MEVEKMCNVVLVKGIKYELNSQCVFHLQVTQSNQPVYSLTHNLHHGKRPYECVLLATTHEQHNDEFNKMISNLDQKLIVSVPCAVPSAKPPLNGLLFCGIFKRCFL
jgi:hypothetical protein